MSEGILNELSRLVATALDSGDFSNLAADMAKAAPGVAQIADALDQAKVYRLEAHRPAFGPDGEPGYLSQDVDLKQAVLHELRAMAGADFDSGEHSAEWASVEREMAALPEDKYRDGLTVSCPDDYILSLLCQSCSEALRSRGVRLPGPGQAITEGQ